MNLQFAYNRRSSKSHKSPNRAVLHKITEVLMRAPTAQESLKTGNHLQQLTLVKVATVVIVKTTNESLLQ